MEVSDNPAFDANDKPGPVMTSLPADGRWHVGYFVRRSPPVRQSTNSPLQAVFVWNI